MDEKQLRRQILDDVFDAFLMISGGNWISLYDIKGKETRYSPGAVEMFDLPGEYIPEGAYDWSDYVHPEDRKRYEDVMGALIATGTLNYDLTYRVRTKDGSYGLFRFVGAVIRDTDGNPSLVGGLIINEGLMENTDPITILRNANGFSKDLNALLRENKECTILMLGFSRLSDINEKHGYGYGNRLLQHVGWMIQENVGEIGTVYRLDGSKFAYITEERSPQEVAGLYEKLRIRLQSGFTLGGVRHNLSANGGLLSTKNLRMNDLTIRTCLNYAYHESKQRKHGNLVVFDGSVNRDARDTLEMIDRIRESIVDDCKGFFLEYQPVIATESGQVAGAEALLRWQEEQYGTVMPLEFVPMLEQDFLFVELGEWVLRQAMADGVKMLEKHSDFILGVNVSPVQIEDEFFIDSLCEISEDTGFPLKHLCLELTENCRRIDIDDIKKILFAVREEGVRYMVDDFGSGFGSLDFLRELSADFVKFDRKYLEGIEENETARDGIGKFCELVAVYGTHVAVKGVENERMAEILKDYPIDYMQGFFRSKAVGVEEFLGKM